MGPASQVAHPPTPVHYLALIPVLVCGNGTKLSVWKWPTMVDASLFCSYGLRPIVRCCHAFAREGLRWWYGDVADFPAPQALRQALLFNVLGIVLCNGLTVGVTTLHTRHLLHRLVHQKLESSRGQVLGRDSGGQLRGCVSRRVHLNLC